MSSLLPTLKIANVTSDATLSASPDLKKLQSYPSKPRIFILTDILNEPDDSQSLVRLLLYADQLDIRGLVAVTSTWLRNTTYPEEIKTIIHAYGKVRTRLNNHVHPNYPFPPAEDLLAVVSSGPVVYGRAALSEPISPGAELLIAALKESTLPLYLSSWGGVNVLAQALSHLDKTVTVGEASQLRSRLRVYTISDQDNTASWIRGNYPDIRYTSSVHAMNMYSQSTWLGISGDYSPAVSHALVEAPWLAANIQVASPLGAVYPNTMYTMEGDTPSFLYLLQNGLGDKEHMDWGSWGGRYGLVNLDVGDNHFVDTIDRVVGADGGEYKSAAASVWRWRAAYQNDFASRMAWTLSDEFAAVGHAPVVCVNGSSSQEALIFENAAENSPFSFDTEGTWGPDHPDEGAIHMIFEWFQYWDPSATDASFVPASGGLVVESLDQKGGETRLEVNANGFQNATLGAKVRVTVAAPSVASWKSPLHLVLAVTSSKAKFPVTRYKRIVFYLAE